MKYTIRDLARMRRHELLTVWLSIALPGRKPSATQTISAAAAAASSDGLMSLILDAQ